VKRQEHIEEAERIGADSWGLNSFNDLPRDASCLKQIEALKADRRWIEDHINSVLRSIDYLIQEVDKWH